MFPSIVKFITQPETFSKALKKAKSPFQVGIVKPAQEKREKILSSTNSILFLPFVFPFAFVFLYFYLHYKIHFF